MGVKRCAWGECKSDSRLSHKPSMSGVHFIRFPKPKSLPEKCDRWIRACSRGDDFGRHRITQDTYVCSLHFVGGNGPTNDHPDPILATARPNEIRLLERKKRAPPKERPLLTSKPKKQKFPSATVTFTQKQDENSCPLKLPVTLREESSVFTRENKGTLEPLQLNQEHSYSMPDRSSPCSVTENCASTCLTSLYPSPSCDGLCNGIFRQSEDSFCEVKFEKPTVCDASTQTNILATDIETYSDQHLKDPQLLKRHLFMQDVLKDDKSCKFYTGIASLQLLMFLFTWLKSKAERLTLWKGEETSNIPANKHDGRGRALSTFEAFILLLVRLRRGLDVEHLSDLFGIAGGTVSRYFRTWLEFMSRELSFLIVWPNQEQVRSNLPKAFKHFRKTVGIIDCTELFVQKPSLPSSQRITWSHYKHHNTFKALVSISPSGAFTYLSDLWTGSASDRRITQECGFLEKVNYGDDIMADRGFLIRDLLALRGATLNIPPFAHGKQLSSAAVTKTRRIASARIHVERAIGRLKNFKILQGILPLKSKKLMNQTVKLCAQLCNLDKKLVK